MAWVAWCMLGGKKMVGGEVCEIEWGDNAMDAC